MFTTRASAAMTAVTVLTVLAASTEVRAQAAADGFSGIVYEDVDADGMWDPAVDRPLTGWPVFADINQDRTRQDREPQAVTGPDGAYFVATQPGTYSVRIEVADGWVPLRPTSGVVDVTVASTGPGGGGGFPTLPGPPRREGDPEFSVTQGVHFGVFRPASVGDRVWMDLDGNGMQSGDEPGLPGVVVRLLAASNSAVLGATVTDGLGGWRFDELFPGTYRAQIFVPAGFRITGLHAGSVDADSDFDPESGLSSNFTLGPGQTLNSLDAGLVPEAHIGFVATRTRAVEGSTSSVFPALRLDLPSGMPLQTPVVVTIEDDGTGTAASGKDYALPVPSVTFPAGATDGTIVTYPVQILDDDLVEGSESAELRLVSLTGPAFLSSAVQHEVLIEDDDGRGLSVTVPPNPATDENGGRVSFAVVLDAMPRSNVVIEVQSSDAGEAVVSPATLTFSADTWNVPQTVTVTGVDDAVFDGTVSYTVTLDPSASEDTAWSTLQSVGLPFVNRDNEVRISGRLWQDLAPANDVRDDTDGRLSQWSVRATDGIGDLVQSAETDASGSYEFVLSGGGTYRIVFPPELGYVRRDAGLDDTVDSDADDEGIVNLSLTEGTESLHVDAGITPDNGWEIAVRVFLDLDRDGIRDPGEGTLPGVTVSLVTMGGSTIFSVPSTDEGTPILRFVGLHAVRPGEYRMAATAPSGYYFTTANQGSDRTADSDIDPSSGLSAPFRMDYPGCCTQPVSGIDVGLQSLEFTLSVNVSGDGTGRIVSQPDGISCSDSCSADFPAGTLAALTAIPDPGSVFAGWSGDCSGSEPCSLVMNRNRTVTAYFVDSTSPLPLLQRWMVLLTVGGDTRRFRIDLCEDEGPWLEAPIAATALLDRALEAGWGSSAISTGCSDDRAVVRVVDEGLGILLTKEVSLPGTPGSPRLLVVSGVTGPRPWPDPVSGGRPLDARALAFDGSLPVLQMIYDLPEAGTAGLAQDSPLLLDPGPVTRRGFGSAEPTDPSLETMLIASSEGDTTVFVGEARAASVLVAHGFAHPMSWERGIAVDALDASGTIGSLVRGGRVSGRVFSDLDRSGTWDQGEPGLPGVPIDVYRDGVIHVSTASDADGRWALALEPGAYVVQAHPVIGADVFTPFQIVLNSDQHVPGVDFAAARVSGVSTEGRAEIPLSTGIDSVFPNPFEDEFSMVMRLPEPALLSAYLVDLVGRRTEVMPPSMWAAGSHVVPLSPEPLAAGVYLLVVQAGSRTFSTTVVRAR